MATEGRLLFLCASERDTLRVLSARVKAGRGDPPVRTGLGGVKGGGKGDLTCPITRHKCGIAVSGGRPSLSTRMCAARRSGAASDRKGSAYCD